VPDLLLSCAAIRKVPDWLPWAGEAPKLLEWPGVPTEGGHPSWQRAALSLRDSDGAILPNLLGRYRQFLGFDAASVGRIAVVGFSAGSNSGVRALLESPLDRARVDFVAAVDGMHPTLAPQTRGVRRFSTSDVESQYAAWGQQMGPFAAYALDAASGSGMFIGTASAIVHPIRTVASTMLALGSLFDWVASHVGPSSPNLPASFPPRTDSPSLRAGEVYPTPYQMLGAGNFVAAWYPGADSRAHELQAWVVVPDILRAFLVPRWGGPSPGLVSFDREPSDPAPTSSPSHGAPNWTPLALSFPAAVAVALSPR